MYKKGYQEYDTAVSSVSTKVNRATVKSYTTADDAMQVKGIGATCRVPGVALSACNDTDVRVWDVADYVVPPEENDALFITTNAVEVSFTFPLLNFSMTVF